MSFKATLYIDDLEANVLSCEYELLQHTDYNGKPSSKSQGGRVLITIESTSDLSLYDWAASHTQTKSGRIVFLKRDQASRLKELRFTDAYAVKMKERFDYRGFHPTYLELELSAKEVSVGNTPVSNAWAV